MREREREKSFLLGKENFIHLANQNIWNRNALNTLKSALLLLFLFFSSTYGEKRRILESNKIGIIYSDSKSLLLFGFREICILSKPRLREALVFIRKQTKQV